MIVVFYEVVARENGEDWNSLDYDENARHQGKLYVESFA